MPPAWGGAAEAPRGMVATVHPLATQAGTWAVAQGGNAVDAAVAAALMLGVVDNHNSGLGGGCFVLARLPDGGVMAIDGRETAPQAATPDMYLKDGEVQPSWSQTGPLAVGVPGALAAYEAVLEKHGRLTLAELLRYAASIAERGFPIDRVYASNLEETAGDLRRFAGSRQLFFGEDGQLLHQEGDLLRQPDLASTYRNIAAHGTDWFYRGEFAARIGNWMADHGGILTKDDFCAYHAKPREPIETTYRGYRIFGFPPPSSGGIHVAQILNILENFDLAAIYREDPAAAYHLVVEAMKLAFADRAYWLGDADHVEVPRGLVDKRYAAELAERIGPHEAHQVMRHGQPPDWDSRFFGKHTTHIAAADDEGYWVAITATINTSFGSKVIVPGTGIMLNNEMDDFSLQPGVPNAFGLIGDDRNAVAPGKRPLSSMSPTIVLDEHGNPLLTVGAAGGPTIITQVVLALVRVLDFGHELEQAVAEGRLHQQWFPEHVFAESLVEDPLLEELARRGHVIERIDTMGVTQAIRRPSASGVFLGVQDPRVPGQAAGW